MLIINDDLTNGPSNNEQVRNSARSNIICYLGEADLYVLIVVLVHDFVTANIEHIKSVRVKLQQCIVFYVL